MPEHIVDNGPLVGWINRRDQWHPWSVSVMQALEPPLISCESVIAEAAWHLRDSREAVDRLYGLIEAAACAFPQISRSCHTKLSQQIDPGRVNPFWVACSRKPSEFRYDRIFTSRPHFHSAHRQDNAVGTAVAYRRV